ncbi:hypothetical protein Clacol_000064 [Clathrus columnatus]|uniref:Uncharacterized protein n=1 Tax=Clathrus columnatus TaxID=1419009 RepID=A0AAV4ZXZ6_9AGAM|nr:hypothetical protein Clacol_000064 [Clathrus columnatus]
MNNETLTNSVCRSPNLEPLRCMYSPSRHASSIVSHHIAISSILFFRSIVTTLLDVLGFIGTIYQIWGLWRSKRTLGLQSNKDIVAMLLQQALRRRNMEKSVPNLSDIHLPTLSLPSQGDPAQTQRSVLGRLHESLVAEMAERPDEMDINSNHPSGSEELDVDDLRANDGSDNLQDNGESFSEQEWREKAHEEWCGFWFPIKHHIKQLALTTSIEVAISPELSVPKTKSVILAADGVHWKEVYSDQRRIADSNSMRGGSPMAHQGWFDMQLDDREEQGVKMILYNGDMLFNGYEWLNRLKR